MPELTAGQLVMKLAQTALYYRPMQAPPPYNLEVPKCQVQETIKLHEGH